MNTEQVPDGLTDEGLGGANNGDGGSAFVSNGDLLAEHNLRVVHLSGGERQMTVCFREPYRGAEIIEVATALTHRRDRFTRKVGTKTAIEHFLAGKTIILPKDKELSPVDQVFHYFEG
jgi:hypothetical protein